MTVKELIALLEKMPPNAEVIYHDGDNGWCTPNAEYITKYPRYVYASKVEYIYGQFVDLSAD